MINGAVYQTSNVLYDEGARFMCGHGTRAFKARVDGETTALVIKDCWLEDGEDEVLEHDAVERVRSAMGQEEFQHRFIDVCGYRVTRNSALDRVCKILQRDFNKREGFHDVSLHWSHRSMVSERQPPRPRFRYQIVYKEMGDSFYHITSLRKAYLDLNDVTKGELFGWDFSNSQRRFAALYSLHTSKFIHGDVHLGNIIEVEGRARLSDPRLVRECDADELSELTLRTPNSPSSLSVERLEVGPDGLILHMRSSATREYDISQRRKLQPHSTRSYQTTTTAAAQREMVRSRS
jgi:hypothetical protein